MRYCHHNLNVLKILSAWGLVFLLALSVRAQTVVINLAEMGANPSTNRNVTIQALSPTIGNLIFYVSDTTTGAVEFVAQPGICYNVVIKSPPAAISFQIYVPAAFSGTMDATNFTSLAPNAVQTFPSAQTAPSWQAALATFQLSGSTFSNNFPTFQQTTNIARGVYSNNPAGYFQAIFTNGFWTTNYIGLNFYPSNNPSGYTTAGVTNGFAPTNWVGANYYPTSNPSAFTPATVTNGFASTNWVGVNFVLQSGQVTNTAGVSNSLWFSKQPASTILTNLAGLANTNQFVFTNDSTWFDVAGTAKAATNGLPGMAFQGTNGWIRTNGATVLGQVPLFTNSGPGWVWATPSAAGAATNAWNLGGNATLGSFVGTTTTNPFVMVANGQAGITLYSPQTYDMRITMGLSNTITADSASNSNRNSAILSGVFNNIFGGAVSDAFDGQALVIIGGIGNTNASTAFGLIGNGLNNLLSSHPFETIINGASNHVASVNFGTIVNGQQNSLIFSSSLGAQTVVNGLSNTIAGVYGIVGDGTTNVVESTYSTVLNGENNQVLGASTSLETILNGIGNAASGKYDLIGSGLNETNGEASSTILNGSGNNITGGLGGSFLDILNGQQNSIALSGSSISDDILNGKGNAFNLLSGGNPSIYNQIFDGNGNLMTGTGSFFPVVYTFIANGNGNTMRSDTANWSSYSFILDGQTNTVASSAYSGILSGSFDVISNANNAFILSGTNTYIQFLTNAVAIGNNETITNNNSVLISDGYPISSLTNNQMILSFSNGVDIRTNLTINGKAAAIVWGAVTNLTAAYRPASVYYFVTNGTPLFGILTTN